VTAAPTRSAGCPSGHYAPGAAITLSGDGAAAGWTLTGWTGTLSRINDASDWAYTMPSAAASQTAQFAQCFVLTLDLHGPDGVLTASPTHSLACVAGSYLSGTALSITAAPTDLALSTFRVLGAETASGDAFALSTEGSSGPFNYTMPAEATTIIANFVACVALSTSTTGGGSISAVTSWLHTCPAGSLPEGAMIEVTAIPDSNHALTGWTGDFSGSSSPIFFTMPSVPSTLVANFAPCFPLSTGVTGSGSGLLSRTPPRSPACPNPGTYLSGTSITMVATANSGSTFVNWGGASTDTTATTTFVMPTSSATLTANFAACYALTLVQPATGGSIAAPSPARSYACAVSSFVAGASVTLTAVPQSNYTLAAWSGGVISGTTNPSTFTMPGNATSVGASFAKCLVLTL